MVEKDFYTVACVQGSKLLTESSAPVLVSMLQEAIAIAELCPCSQLTNSKTDEAAMQVTSSPLSVIALLELTLWICPIIFPL